MPIYDLCKTCSPDLISGRCPKPIKDENVVMMHCDYYNPSHNYKKYIKVLDEYQDPDDNYFKRLSVCEICNKYIIEIETSKGLEVYNGCICEKNKNGGK